MTNSPHILTDPALKLGADFAAWRAAGGGRGLEAALAAPDRIIETIAASGLRGMGGAGFPTHRKWEAAAKTSGADKYVVCNGNEDEPGTFKDRYLLRWTPHQVIEGALIAALAIKANHVILYINPHQTDGISAAWRAVAQWDGQDLLRRLESAIGKPVTLEVLATSGRYIGGEETAVISWIEGGFPFPRSKPPFPAESGIHGAPTLINNTETLANVPHILTHGPDWYQSLGIGAAVGTKLYSLSGDVVKPGLYELPMGTSLKDLIFVHGGGMLSDKPFKAVFTGGPSNTLLTAKDLDVALDFDSVRERRSRLGTGGDDRHLRRHQHRAQGSRLYRLFRPIVLRPMPAVQVRHLPAGAHARTRRQRPQHAARTGSLAESLPHSAGLRPLRADRRRGDRCRKLTLYVPRGIRPLLR
jgi:NADH-quinone oxidoreductase subunit F